MNKYIIFWLLFILIRAIIVGYKNYESNRNIGYSEKHYKLTGEKIPFVKSGVQYYLNIGASVLGLLFLPAFWLIESIKSIPALIVLYVIVHLL